MSSKSRRRANTSRRRLSVVAGGLLAGAAIPFAAAGTAWADVDSPSQLEHQDKVSIAQAEAEAKVAGADGVPVEVSKNGVVIFEENNPGGNGTIATSTKGDTAVAIGADATATAVNGSADFAFADGKFANAYAGGESGKVSSSDTAEDIGTNVGNNNGAVAGGSGSHDTALDIGNNTTAGTSSAFNGASAVYGSYNTAIDIGNNIGAADGAQAGGTAPTPGNYETAIDIGNNGTSTTPNSYVELSGAQAQDGTRDTAIYNGNTTDWATLAQAGYGKYDTATVTGTDSSAVALDGNDNSVSVTGDDNAAYAGGGSSTSLSNSNTVNIVGAGDAVTATGGTDHISVFVSDSPPLDVTAPKLTESLEPFGTFIP